MMGWHHETNFEIGTRGTHKQKIEYWVCHVKLKDIRVPLNYGSLDKRYKKLLIKTQNPELDDLK